MLNARYFAGSLEAAVLQGMVLLVLLLLFALMLSPLLR
jgi:hypothetical protein